MLIVTKGLRDELGLPETAADKDVKSAALKAVKSGKLAKGRIAELCSDKAAGMERREADPANPSPEDVFGKSIGGDGIGVGRSGNVRVIPLKEKFGNEGCQKRTEVWTGKQSRRIGPQTPGLDDGVRKSGEPAYYYETNPATGIAEKKQILAPSKFEEAKMGALMKFFIIRDCGEDNARRCGIALNEYDQQLVKAAMHEDDWVGPGAEKGVNILEARKLKDRERDCFWKMGLSHGEQPKMMVPELTKAPLLGDNTSGGTQAVPQYFDFEAIRTPLLYGELVPFVEITPTDRGASAHSYSIGTPTFVTTASGSAITAFDATSFVSTFDVTFYPASCGFQWGRDFEMDAAPNIGQMIVAQMGDQFKYQMDNWIAVGDGTTQPQGLNNAGLGSVSATGSSHATMVYNDGLNLMFGITKPFRKAFGGDCTMFISTEKMYKKFMQLATGVTGDTRPIYGMHLKDFQLGDYHFAIQNDIADGTVFACNLRGYRLYRRLGLYFELLTTGSTLTLANLKLLFARARFGGKITLTGYGAKMTSLQIG